MSGNNDDDRREDKPKLPPPSLTLPLRRPLLPLKHWALRSFVVLVVAGANRFYNKNSNHRLSFVLQLKKKQLHLDSNEARSTQKILAGLHGGRVASLRLLEPRARGRR